MKKIFNNIEKTGAIVIGLVLLTFTISSCDKDFLEESPQDRISDGQFWKSSSDLRLYANNFYNYFPSYAGYFTFGPYGLDADQGSDNMIKTAYNSRLNGELTVSNAGGWNWSDIRNINYFLDNYSKSTEDFDVIKKYVGEAYFFKAMRYFEKVKTFGDVPWFTNVVNTGDDALYAARTPRKVVVDSIINNLDKAISYLPSKNRGESFRINKEIAMLLQARIALYEGTWEKYHQGTDFGVASSDGSSLLTKAAEVSENIINSGVYSLDNTGVDMGYWKLFNQSDYSSSSEIMFWRKWDVANGLFSRWSRYSRFGTGRGITKSLVDDYLCTDGKPISGNSLYQGDDNLLNLVKNRDPRLAQTIQVNDGDHYVTEPTVPFTYPAFDGANEDKCVTGYQIYKGHSPDANQQTDRGGDIGVIYFRYAEALLIFAEAKAELGSLSQSDVDKSINLLRDRVGMPHLNIGLIETDPNWSFPSLSGVINEVRRERRIELAAEGYRHDDIMRWAAADELISNWKPKGAKRNQWDGVVDEALLNYFSIDGSGYIELYKESGPMANGYQFKLNRDYLLPIPLDQITLNPNLTQNPNW